MEDLGLAEELLAEAQRQTTEQQLREAEPPAREADDASALRDYDMAMDAVDDSLLTLRAELQRFSAAADSIPHGSRVIAGETVERPDAEAALQGVNQPT
jgi:transcription elongation GreA/GreB family factor